MNEMENQRFTPGDPLLIENIVSYLKAKGIFDEFRHECLADVDTKSSCQNLSQRVDGYTTKFLSNETWNSDLNKNELRNKLRRHIDESGMLAVGADHVGEQVINPKIGQLFLPRIIEVVHQYLKEENEKLSKQQESIIENAGSEKIYTENTDGNSNRIKTPVLDPIADILSFTYSKPKSTSQATIPKSELVNKKGADISIKIEKKKEEDITQLTKNPDIVVKTDKKEDISQAKGLDILVKSEKVNEDNIVKLEANESPLDNLTLLTKPQTDCKEPIKLKKEIKTEEVESQWDGQKKIQRDDAKSDKKKTDDKSNDGSATSEDCAQNKSTNIIPKSSNHSKLKFDIEKSKKVKTHASQKIASHSNDQRKLKIKESLDNKTWSEKHSKPSTSKSSKSSSKDSSSPFRSNISKSLKKERSEESSVKIKPTDPPKSSDITVKKSSKSSFLKKESTSTKMKYSSDTNEKQKSSKKPNVKLEYHSQSSTTNSEKGSKNTLQYSSSYESSQGSDQDRNSFATDNTLKKQKHYSKHHKKESTSKETSMKNENNQSNQKRSQKESEHSAVKKVKGDKSSKLYFQEKLNETILTHDSAKISSRSNSFGSTSSTNDSSNISKEGLLSSSDDTSQNSSKHMERKKKTVEKDRCSSPQDLPPPPPPPPPSDSIVLETTSSSPEETTQSSQESYSEIESGDSSSGSDDDSCSSSVLQTSSHNSGLETTDLNDFYDILLYSSSSSEFEGFCSSPEKNKEKSSASDVSVSSVHTSDLSSYDDEISADDLSSEDIPNPDNPKIKKKISLKKVQELLRREDAEQISDDKKNVSYEGTLEEEKSSEILHQISTVITSSEEEISPQPRRELRRERKLNPKYASNEYTSIFNSKRTSFITKQINQSPPKQNLIMSHTVNPNSTNELFETASKEKVSNEIIPAKNTDKKDIVKERFSTVTNITQGECSESIASKNLNHVKDISDGKEHETHFEAEKDLIANEFNSNSSTENDSPIRLTLNIKNSPTKINISKNVNPNGVKRKFDGSEKISNKRLCHRNSVDLSSSKRVNENKPLNNEKNDKTHLVSSESKNNLHKQKANGDVLGKIDRLRKSSQSKANHASDKK